MPSKGALTPRIALLLLLPPLMWAGNALVGRLLVGQVPPMLLNALRWSLAFGLLLPWGWTAFATPAARRQVLVRWWPLTMLGLLGIGCYNALQYQALTTSTPLNVTLIAASSPVSMLLVGAVVYRERPSRRALLGAALSLAGVAVVLARGDPSALLAVRLVAGDVLMLAAILAWAFYSWLLVRPAASLAGGQRPDWDWAGFLLAQVAFGLLWAWGAAGVEALLAPAAVRWSATVVAALVFVALGPSLVAFRSWGIGVAAVGPTIAAFFANLTPLFAALLSALLLGIAPEPYHGVAFLLIGGGIWVSSRP